ncbi:TIGR02265 family protein [Archangium sp.]|uniref:TIGR02265 family protein n=1 Tax=Archangium sp. TaxID=1872627 RepID=UPI002D4E2B65|nr:TIGR02265 family protein [Archangium sp.]HYO58967.1 TIGR02265 family protein [Archangium sp.]
MRAESGLGTEQELRRRLSLATPMDTVRGMSFQTTLEVVRVDLGEEALARCVKQLGEPNYKSFFTYPVSDYLRLQYSAAWMLMEKHGGFDNAIRRTAGGMAPGFLGSVVGKAFMLLTKEGPRQLINNMPVAFRAASSFGEVSVHWTGPRSGVLTTKRDFLLYMGHEGGLLGLFRAMGIKDARVSGRQTGPLDNEVEFSWG